MAQRISRAKQRMRGVPFDLPPADERGERLRAVLHVLYLIFSEGYTASSGSALQRVDLSTEAIRLTRMLHGLLPDVGEIQGLLALMLLTDARRDARTGPAGELIPLDRQDRSAWNRAVIAEGVALVSAALSKGSIGAYQLQAAIAAVHDEAPSADATDWPQILALYGLLQRMSDNPMVALNHAIATAMVHGAEAGLKAIDELAGDSRLAGSHRLDAVRAHLLERAERPEEAVEYYRRSAEQTSSTPERNYLLTQAARLNDKARERSS
jgi:predicted RNA polymerase sigma factor